MQGVTLFTYPDDYPDYYPRIQDRKFPPGEPLVTASTANVIFRTAPIRELDLNFDVGLAEYGGSDADFFFRLHKNGASILHSAHAVVIEPLHGVRASLSWQARRRIRTSQSWFFAIGGITPDESPPLSKKVLGLYRHGIHLIVAFLRGAMGLVMSPKHGRKRFLQALMDLMPVIAVLMSALGVRIREYKQPRSKESAQGKASVNRSQDKSD